MAGAIHAVALMALLAATTIAVVRFPQKPRARQAIVATLAGVLLAGLSMAVSAHACGLGQPVSQWLIPAACIIAAVMLVANSRVRRIIGVVCFGAGIGLSLHYASEVHGSEFVGLASPDAHYRVGRTQDEWHTWLTGLFRRVGADEPKP